MKTAIITDSSANLTKEYLISHPNVFMVPLMILIDGVEFRDQVEIDALTVYQKLDSSKVSTSLPNTEDLHQLINRLINEQYTDIIAINISSGLSGTFNAFRLAFNDIKGINITHYDSKTLAGALGYLVEYATELSDLGKTPEEIIPLLNECRFENSLAFYTINTLKYLRKGGRIGFVEGTIGDILHVKPVITVNQAGVYETLSKGFGLNRSLITMRKLMVEKFGDKLIDFTVHYGSDLVKAKELAERMKTDLNIRNLTISPLTPVLGIHTGPEMFAYIARLV
jgi:DegV family protein with EDD domain